MGRRNRVDRSSADGHAGPRSDRAVPYRGAIVAPQEGDRYQVPPGVEHRYATIALRAGGGLGRAVRWFVDDTALTGDRWALHAGAHIVRAEAGPGEQAEVRIEVE